jgi:3-oxo-5-alpha-steroid 4-dehydrogenase 1
MPDAYTIVLWAIFIAATLTFVTLFFLDAPYGRFMRNGWGVALSARWAWGIMEFPAALSIFTMALLSSERPPLSLFFLAIWEIHYLYRTFLYPGLLPGGSTRNVPVVLIVVAILYNVANGYVNGHHLFFENGYDAEWSRDPRFVAGVVFFLAGLVIHISSDRILQRLRPPGTREYHIPYSGLYRWVSCPNYLGEIIEWCGFALATWSVAGLSFAVFTIANLLPRAIANHRWYRETFADYPSDRKALIPYLL